MATSRKTSASRSFLAPRGRVPGGPRALGDEHAVHRSRVEGTLETWRTDQERGEGTETGVATVGDGGDGLTNNAEGSPRSSAPTAAIRSLSTRTPLGRTICMIPTARRCSPKKTSKHCRSRYPTPNASSTMVRAVCRRDRGGQCLRVTKLIPEPSTLFSAGSVWQRKVQPIRFGSLFSGTAPFSSDSLCIVSSGWNRPRTVEGRTLVGLDSVIVGRRRESFNLHISPVCERVGGRVSLCTQDVVAVVNSSDLERLRTTKQISNRRNRPPGRGCTACEATLVPTLLFTSETDSYRVAVAPLEETIREGVATRTDWERPPEGIDYSSSRPRFQTFVTDSPAGGVWLTSFMVWVVCSDMVSALPIEYI